MRATDDSVDGDLLSPVITVDAAPAGPRAAVIAQRKRPRCVGARPIVGLADCDRRWPQQCAD
jgi:hypothetical protein